ncbi:MAG: MerR family transcriptional regulator, partial [Clostridium sp.]
RYYTGYDIQLFLNIKELKRRGLQLRAIKKLIPQITVSMSGFEESGAALLEGVAEDISEDAPTRAEEDINTEKRTDTVKAEIHNNEKILEFQTILERLIAQDSQNEDEERCRSLDFSIRRQQMARREAAAASEKKGKRKHRDGVEKK